MIPRNRERYDKAVNGALLQAHSVFNEFSAWCGRNGYKVNQILLNEYFEDYALEAAIYKVGHNRFMYSVNDYFYTSYPFRVESNAHYSAIIKCLQLRTEQIEEENKAI